MWGAREAAAGDDQGGLPKVGDICIRMKDERGSLAELDGGETGDPREHMVMSRGGQELRPLW